MRGPLAQPLAKFFADRGTHLAAMIAYFGLLSSVSLIFLALAVLGWTGRRRSRATSSRRSSTSSPRSRSRTSSRSSRRSRENATTLGVIGARVPALDVALALQRARVGLQHRLRPAEPAVPARQVPGDAVHGRLDHRPRAGLVIGGSFGYDLLQRFAGGLIANADRRLRALGVLISTVAVFLFLVARLRAADERAPDAARGLAGRRARRRAPAGDVPGAADLRPPLARGGRGAGARRLGAAARLDLRDGERDRLRRRGELVVRPPRRGRG